MNTEKIVRVLQGSKGLGCNELTCNGTRCVIAELLAAAGYSPQKLRTLSSDLDVREHPAFVPEDSKGAQRTLRVDYSISRQDIADLLSVNDEYHLRLGDAEFYAFKDLSFAAQSRERLAAVIFAVEHWDDYLEAYGHTELRHLSVEGI